MKNEKGNSVVEFAFILPWFLLALLVLIRFSLWMVASHMGHYAAFQGARFAGLYDREKAKGEIGRLLPQSRIRSDPRESILRVSRGASDLALPLEVGAPVFFALEGMDFSFFGRAGSDNPVDYCEFYGRFLSC